MFRSILEDTDAILELTSLMVEVPARPELWNRLCDAIAERQDAVAFMVFAYDLQKPSSPMFYGSRITWDEMSELRQMFADGDASGEDDEGYQTLALSQTGRVLNEPELFGLGRLEVPPPNSWRDKVLKAVGANARYAMKLNDMGPYLDVAVFHSLDASIPYLEALNSDAALLQPLIAKALETSRTFEALTRSYRGMLDLFDDLDFAVAFCDAEGQILIGNRHFEFLIRERDGLYRSAGRLVGETAKVTSRISECIAASLHEKSPPGSLSALIPRRSSARPLLLRAVPARNGQVRRHATLTAILVLDPEDERRINTEGLASFDVLSPAELEVSRELVRGLSTQEISVLRNTTVETTRGQVKSVQSKLGCRSRLDLVRLALSSSAPINSQDNTPSGG